jgi:PIN domain nuclease of toxin-antitoxin system
MRSGRLVPALLLDTCAVIWLQNADAMTKSAVEAIVHAGRSDGVLISPISAWEIGLISRPSTHRSPVLQFLPDAKTWFQKTMAGPGVKAAPLTPEIAIHASFLPGNLHGDPADRIIIATARHLGVPVVTRDRQIIEYGRSGNVAVIPC